MHSSHLAAIVLALAPSAFAQLSTFRGTIPGSLHQCENTTMDFFDSGATRPLDVLFLPSASVPTALLTGTTTLNAALKAVGPLFAIEGITTPDASAYPFILQLAAGSVVEIFAFLPDGTGKNLNLPRTIMTPLPAATNCLVNVKSIPGAGAVTAVPTTAASAATAAVSSKASSAKVSSVTSAPTSTSSSASSAPASASSSKAASGTALAISGAAAVVGLVAGAFML